MENFIGPSILKNYILERFTDATYYYLFRKRVRRESCVSIVSLAHLLSFQVAQQLAVLSVLEMVVHLSPLFLDDMYIRTSTAQLAAPRYKFTLNRGKRLLYVCFNRIHCSIYARTLRWYFLQAPSRSFRSG